MDEQTQPADCWLYHPVSREGKIFKGVDIDNARTDGWTESPADSVEDSPAEPDSPTAEAEGPTDQPEG